MEENEEKSCYLAYYHGSADVIGVFMNKVEGLKLELAKAIRESAEYMEYKRLHDALMRQPDLKRMVDEFRRENFSYQYSNDVEDPLGASLALDERFAPTRANEFVSRFLIAEMQLCRLIQDVCLTVVGSVDFDMDFLQ